MNRKTSLYTLRLDYSVHALAIGQALDALNVTVTDRGDKSVSWRATDDADATRTATAALVHAGIPDTTATLTTGLGVHRRTVAEQ